MLILLSYDYHFVVHGCLDELVALLQKCNFDANIDQLVLVGDLVNKGRWRFLYCLLPCPLNLSVRTCCGVVWGVHCSFVMIASLYYGENCYFLDWVTFYSTDCLFPHWLSSCITHTGLIILYVTLSTSLGTSTGPKSAEVVQYVRSVPHVLCVLGNHDEALLKVSYISIRPYSMQTFSWFACICVHMYVCVHKWIYACLCQRGICFLY